MKTKKTESSVSVVPAHHSAVSKSASEHHHLPHHEHQEHHDQHHAPPADELVQISEPLHHHPQEPKSENLFTWWTSCLLALAVIVLIFNQVMISSLAGTGFTVSGFSQSLSLAGGKDLQKVDIDSLKSTGHTVAAVFPVENLKTSDDALAMMFPSGTPDYGGALGVSFDDPVGSLSTLSSMYRGLKAEVEQKNPEAWQRFMNLASKPVGISCEYCCGVGPIGINKNGDSACGCQHNPALLSVALYLTAYTDYSDGEILREVMRWKTLFFPKNMIELGVSVAGGDTSKLNLPGMVGGC